VSGRKALLLLFLVTLPLVTLRIRGSDEIQYFAVLRSAVIDHDLEYGNEYRHFYELDPRGLEGFGHTFLERLEPRTGRHISFAAVGSALLWAPFYLLAHAGVLLADGLGAGVPADGYARPYVVAVCYASALYGFAGLLLIHDVLVRRAGIGEPAASGSVAVLWLATPILYYLAVAPAFAHAGSLFAVSLMLWLWLRAREHDTPWAWAAVGAAAGLAGLVREQDVFFAVVPAADLLRRALRSGGWRDTALRLAAFGAAAAALFTLQLATYHAVNGGWGPSTLVARKMSWSSPHLLAVLFDPGHGLFPWTPLLLPACCGLVLAARRQRDITLLLVLGLLVQAWVGGSVESWTQAGAFGSRRFVGSSLIFAWGLAPLLEWLRPRLGRFGLGALLAVFMWWNVSLIVQFGLKLMDRQRLEWPRVAVNQVREVPWRLGRVAWLYLTDRERLVREGP